MTDHNGRRKAAFFTAVVLVNLLGSVAMSGLAVAETTTLTVVEPADDDGDGTVDVRSAASGSPSEITVAAGLADAGDAATFAVDRDGNFSTTDDQGIDGGGRTVTITDGGDRDNDGVADGQIRASFVVDGGSEPLSDGPVSIGVDAGDRFDGGPAATVSLEVDNGPPAIESATTRDAGDGEGIVIGGGTDDRSPAARNGRIDQLAVTFNETVDDSSVQADAVEVAGYGIDAIKTGSEPNDERVVVDLVEGEAPDTDATPTLNVSAGAVVDEAGNPFAGVTGLAATDGAPPVMTAAATADDDRDGRVEAVDVNLSEPLGEGSDVTEGFESEPYPADGARRGPSDEQLSVDLDGTPTDNTSVTPENLTVAGGALSDGANTLDASQRLDGVRDGAAPVVEEFTTTSRGGERATVTVESTERLGEERDALGVELAGPESTTLNRSAFAERGAGPYSYTATGQLDAGNYTATLTKAADAAGNDGATGQSASVAVDDRAAAASEGFGDAAARPYGSEGSIPGDLAGRVPTARFGDASETPFGGASGQATGQRSGSQFAAGDSAPSDASTSVAEIDAPASGGAATAGSAATGSDGAATAVDGQTTSADSAGASRRGRADDGGGIGELLQTVVPAVFAVLFAVALVLATAVTLAVVAYAANE